MEMVTTEVSKYPLATLKISFYNQENFVRDTIKGALAQTYPNLEIILSDDCSQDNTFEVIKECVANYRGPHKIILNRNEKNMGLVPHFNKATFELSHGEYIFLNGGDDVSLPNRVEDAVRAFEENPTVAAVTFSRIIINKNGKEIGKVEAPKDHISVIDKNYLRKDNFMAGASALSIRRSLLEIFGKLNDDCQTEDSVLRFRSLLAGGILNIKEFGLKYRVHDTNISRSLGNFNTELIARQYRKDLECRKDYLSEELYEALLKKIDFYQHYRSYQVLCEQNKYSIKRIMYNIRMYILKMRYYRSLLHMSLF